MLRRARAPGLSKEDDDAGGGDEYVRGQRVLAVDEHMPEDDRTSKPFVVRRLQSGIVQAPYRLERVFRSRAASAYGCLPLETCTSTAVTMNVTS
jgi:hypothetical protein